MIPLSQRDPRWRNIPLGFSSTTTIGSHGCTITCIAMILGTTPDVVNERLKAVNGYANTNLVIWAKLEEAFPGIKIKRVWSYDNEDVKKNVPNVLVEVDGQPIGGHRHWVVFVGNQKMIDPWDGKEKSTASYPHPQSYCVIGGKWNKPSPQPDLSSELDKVREARDRHWNDLMKIKQALYLQGEYSIDAIINRIDSLLSSERQLGEKDKRLQEVETRLKDLQSELNNKIDEYIKLQAINEELQKRLEEQERKINNLGSVLQEAKLEIEHLQRALKKPEESGLQLIAKGVAKLLLRR